jgi:molecular chaperone DnaK (HSP70)
LSIQKVYTDYVRCIFNHTKTQRSRIAGDDLWKQYGSQAEVVFTHPNSWRKRQRDMLECAAVQSGLISSRRASKALHFIEEAQAAARFCISANPDIFGKTPLTVRCISFVCMHSLLTEFFQVGTQFIVCDAGGGTVDITAFELRPFDRRKLIMEEIESPICEQKNWRESIRF